MSAARADRLDARVSERCQEGRHAADGLAVGGVCQDAAGCYCSCHVDAERAARLRVLADGDPITGREAVPVWPVRDLAAHLTSSTPALRTGLTGEQAEAVVDLVLRLGWRPVWAPTCRPDCSPVSRPATSPGGDA